MDQSERLCDRIAIVYHGKVIALGTPGELILSLGGEQLVELTCDRPLAPAVFADMAEISGVRPQGDRLLLSARDPARSLPAILAAVAAQGAQLLELAVRHATLEDVFVKLT